MTKFWELNEDREIVALVDFWDVKAGDVGAVIPEAVVLGSQEQPIWVHRDVELGNGVKIGIGTKISERAKLGDGVVVGVSCKIGNGVEIGNRVKIGDSAEISNRAKIGDRTKLGIHAKIGNFTKIGNNVKIGNGSKIGNGCDIGDCTKTGDRVEINNYAKISANSVLNNNFVQFTSFGLKTRTVIFYISNGEAVVSVGCQCGISFEKFKERVNNAEDTSKESAAMYQQAMPMFEAAYNYVKSLAQ